MSDLTEPSFIDRDPLAVTAEMVAQYEAMAGKTLYPAQVERLLVDLIAYRETLTRVGIQEAAKQNLVSFARGDMLDYLGEMLGVKRLPAQPARATARLTFEAPAPSGFEVAAGTRLETASGLPFQTEATTAVATGAPGVDLSLVCDVAGPAGNGYLSGQPFTLLDDLPLPVSAAVSFTVSRGGADAEADERLRARLYIAAERFSCGTLTAYRFHALSVGQSIIDVAVTSTGPGVIRVSPLTADGLPDEALLAAVRQAVTRDDVKPLTDQVIVAAPERIGYTIDVRLTLFANANPVAVVKEVEAVLSAYAANRRRRLGLDVVPEQIVAEAGRISGVYRAVVAAPALIAIAPHQWPDCESITVTLNGVADG